MIFETGRLMLLKSIFSRKHHLTHLGQPRVSVLVPAYQASTFIRDTLDSLEKQSFRDYDLHISIDKSDDDTEQVVCAWCEEHPHLHPNIYYQNSRLGWVENINFLIKKCRNQYFMILPHDDLLHKNYIIKLVTCLQQNKEASVAYTDIRRLGPRSKVISQSSINGSQCERTVKFLKFHFNAVAFRGLVNKEVMSELLYLPAAANKSSFAKDTVWGLQMAIQGPMIRVPKALYFKRVMKVSARSSWQAASDEEKIKAWLDHCVDCRDVIARAEFNSTEQTQLLEALQDRLLQRFKKLCYSKSISRLTAEEQDHLIADLIGE